MILIQKEKISMAPPLGQIITSFGGNPGKTLMKLKDLVKDYSKKKVYVEMIKEVDGDVEMRIVRLPLIQIIRDVLGFEGKFIEKRKITKEEFEKVYEIHKDYLMGNSEEKKKLVLINSMKSMNLEYEK